MRLTINGKTHDIDVHTLDTLLIELGYEDNWLATAVNNKMVRAADRSTCRLSDGDLIEILSPRQGG